MKQKNMTKVKVIALTLGLTLGLTLAQTSLASVTTDLKTAASLVEKGQDAQAQKILNQVISQSKGAAKGEVKNEAILTFGRMKFQEKKFNEAIVVYKQIPSTSKFWPQALEERAWAELNLANFEGALSLYNTLTSSTLSGVVGPEVYLIGAIADLRICNYKGIFDDIKLFKDRFRPRIQALNNSPSQKYASEDLHDIQSVIKKMHIIEIEAIQRMGLKRAATKDFSKVASNNNADDTITFPKESEEWLDESKFDVSAKHCVTPAPKLSAAKAGDKNEKR